jgi:hypothetical protein
MGPPRIESLDNDAMNGRVAGLVSRCWHRQATGSTWARTSVVKPAVWIASGLPWPGRDAN